MKGVNLEAARRSDDRLAEKLRGFGPIGIVAFVVIAATQIVAPLNAVLVLLWAHRSRTPWRDIGYVRPNSWMLSLLIGVVFGIAFKLLMKALAMPLLGADPINRAYHDLAGNERAAIAFALQLIVTAGFGEETFFRGYLFERFGKLLGQSGIANATAVVITTVFFASLHYLDQGLAGVEQAVATGLVFGTIFAVRRRIFVLMVAHTAFDLTALALIYWNLESAVAHSVFR